MYNLQHNNTRELSVREFIEIIKNIKSMQKGLDISKYI